MSTLSSVFVNFFFFFSKMLAVNIDTIRATQPYLTWQLSLFFFFFNLLSDTSHLTSPLPWLFLPTFLWSTRSTPAVPYSAGAAVRRLTPARCVTTPSLNRPRVILSPSLAALWQVDVWHQPLVGKSVFKTHLTNETTPCVGLTAIFNGRFRDASSDGHWDVLIGWRTLATSID